MKRLTAQYQIELTEGLAVKGSDSYLPSFTTIIDGFDVTITFVSQWPGAGSKLKNERLMTRDYKVIHLTVSREESDAPPLIRNEAGGFNFAAQAPYFSSRTGSYAKVAAEALNRLIFFFRYRLYQPFLEEIAHTHQIFRNPRWLDENEDEVGHGPIVDVLSLHTPTYFGVIPFQKKHEKRLTSAIGGKRHPKLYEEFLSDAQTSCLRGNVRRAVLELAIACEVAVKRKFFGKSSGGRTLEYLEDHRNIDVRVIDLISKGAAEVFGANFKDFDEPAYADLDHLFRCRNKVAHRGRAVFRDQHGTMQTATIAIIERWLESARKLFVWLKKLSYN